MNNNADTIKNLRGIMVLLFLIPFLGGILIDLYVPSLPTIMRYYHTSSSMVQLTISAFVLSAGLAQIVLGILSDSIGRHKILMISACFYTLASIACAMAPNIWTLIIGRFLQGIGIAGLSAVIRATAVDCFTGLKLAKAMNNISISWAVGPIVGPYIGGYLQHYFNWQASFVFFAVYGLLLTIYIWRAIPETNKKLQPLNLLHMFRGVKTILLHRTFALYVIVGTLGYTLLVIFNLIGPFLIQEDLHYSVIDYGHIALFMGFAYFLGSSTNRLLIGRFKPENLTLFGISTGLIVSIVMLLLAVWHSMTLSIIIAPAWLIFYFGGFIFPNVMAKFSSIFPHLGGTASAMSGLIICLGTFFVTIYTTFLGTHTQMPMVLTYIGVLATNCALFLLCRRLERC